MSVYAYTITFGPQLACKPPSHKQTGTGTQYVTAQFRLGLSNRSHATTGPGRGRGFCEASQHRSRMRLGVGYDRHMKRRTAHDTQMVLAERLVRSVVTQLRNMASRQEGKVAAPQRCSG